MITREQAIEVFNKLGACREARKWFEDSGLEAEEAWNQCLREDWLFWLASTVIIPKAEVKRKLVLIAYECAKAVLHLIPEGEEPPRQILELMEKWINGEEVSQEELIILSEDAVYGSPTTVSHASSAFSHAAYIIIADSNLAFSDYASDAVYCARQADPNLDGFGIIRKHLPWNLIEEKLKKL